MPGLRSVWCLQGIICLFLVPTVHAGVQQQQQQQQQRGAQSKPTPVSLDRSCGSIDGCWEYRNRHNHVVFKGRAIKVLEVDGSGWTPTNVTPVTVVDGQGPQNILGSREAVTGLRVTYLQDLDLRCITNLEVLTGANNSTYTGQGLAQVNPAAAAATPLAASSSSSANISVQEAWFAPGERIVWLGLHRDLWGLSNKGCVTTLEVLTTLQALALGAPVRENPGTSMLLPSSFAASLTPLIADVERLDNTTVGWGDGADAFSLIPTSCTFFCGLLLPTEECSRWCEDHPACRHWLLVGGTCHFLDHPGPGVRRLSSGGGGSAGSSSRAGTPITPGRDWMFAAVSRWVAAGPYQVEQGGLPWGPKVPREGPAQEALHTPWWIKPLRINQSLIHPYPNTWVDHTRTAATAGPLSGLLVNYAPPPIGTAKGAAAGCVLGLVATYGRGAAAKKAVFGASTSRSNSSLQLAPGCWFNNVTVNASPRCIHSLVLTTTCGQQRLSGGTPNATAPTLTLSPPTNTAADKALKPARRFLAAFQGSPQPNQGPLGILRLVWGMSVPSTAPGVTKPSAGMKLRWVRDINVTIAAEAAPPAAVTARQPRFSQVVIAQDAAAPKICGVRSDAAAAGRLTCVCYACTCRRDIGDLLPKDPWRWPGVILGNASDALPPANATWMSPGPARFGSGLAAGLNHVCGIRTDAGAAGRLQCYFTYACLGTGMVEVPVGPLSLVGATWSSVAVHSPVHFMNGRRDLASLGNMAQWFMVCGVRSDTAAAGQLMCWWGSANQTLTLPGLPANATWTSVAFQLGQYSPPPPGDEGPGASTTLVCATQVGGDQMCWALQDVEQGLVPAQPRTKGPGRLLSCRLSGAKGVPGAQQPKQQQRRLVTCKDTGALGPGGRALVQKVFSNDTDWKAVAAPPWYAGIGLNGGFVVFDPDWYNGTSLVCGVRGGGGRLDGVVECVVPIKAPLPDWHPTGISQATRPATYMHVRPLGM